VTERLAATTLRNSVLVVGARALAKLAVFVVVVLLWRHLGADQYGHFATMIVYVTLVGVIADLGLQTVFIRDASRDRTVLARYLANLLSARLLLSLLALVVLAAALRLLSPALFPYTLAAFVLLLTTSYSSLLRAVFYIRGRLGYEALAIVVESLLLLGLTLIAIQRRATWDAFLWVYSASYLFTCLFAFGVIRWRWHERVTIRLEPAFVRRLLGSGLALALAFTITTVYAQLDIVLLQLFKNFQVVGSNEQLAELGVKDSGSSDESGGGVVPGALLTKLNPLKSLDREGRIEFARRYRELQEHLDNPSDRLAVMGSQGVECAVNYATLPGT